MKDVKRRTGRKIKGHKDSRNSWKRKKHIIVQSKIILMKDVKRNTGRKIKDHKDSRNSW